MGKKARGAKLRSKKRGSEFAKEIVETQALQAQEGSVTRKADDELFVIDTTAIVSSKKQLVRKAKKHEKKHQTKSRSAKEEHQIQKLLKAHSQKELEAMVKSTSITAKRAPKTIKMRQTRPKYDLWAEDESNNKEPETKQPQTTLTAVSSGPHGIVPSSHVKIGTTRALPAPAPKNKERMPVNVDLAKSGQSYNPDGQAHQKSIREALTVETKRELAEKEAKESASQGMSAETKALLLGDTDTEDEDDESENESDDFVIEQRRPEKMTRAQRNKQKRIRAEQWEIQERKRQKRMQHELRMVKSTNKRLKKEEAEKKATKEKKEQLKLEGERSKGKDLYQQLADENPRYAPTYPVALPGELKSGASLRTIKPKGSLLTDRMVSLMDRGMTAKKQLKLKNRIQGKRRKLKVKGKGYKNTKEGDILG